MALALERLPFDLGDLVSERPKRSKRKESLRPKVSSVATAPERSSVPAPPVVSRPSFLMPAAIGALVAVAVAVAAAFLLP